MPARFKLDENLPRDALAVLISAGHDAHSVAEERLDGCPDANVLDASISEDRILITLDLGLADIREYPPSRHRGVWVPRPGTQSIENTLLALRGALALLGSEPARNRLWIVESGRVRIRE